MNNRSYKRFIFLIIFIIILLGVIIGLLFAVLQKPRDIQVNTIIGERGATGQSIVGPAGKDGIGKDGKDGTNANTIVTTVITNVAVPGPQGIQGPIGQSSPQLIVKVDPVTCKFMSKYDGDDLWSILAQFPKPCTPEASDE